MPPRKYIPWVNVVYKAQRFLGTGAVSIVRNGYTHVAAVVVGDNGVYQVEVARQDPNSRAITMWSCECPWSRFAWNRTRQWKKYEGRVCSHALATYWQSLSTPLDDDLEEGQTPGPGERAPAQPQTPAEPLPLVDGEPMNPDLKEPADEGESVEPALDEEEGQEGSEPPLGWTVPDSRPWVGEQGKLFWPEKPKKPGKDDGIDEQGNSIPGAPPVRSWKDIAIPKKREFSPHEQLEIPEGGSVWQDFLNANPGWESDKEKRRLRQLEREWGPLFGLSKVMPSSTLYPHLAHIEDITVNIVLATQSPDENWNQIVQIYEARGQVVVQVAQPIEGAEYRQGKQPHPDAVPYGHSNGAPLYRTPELGYTEANGFSRRLGPDGPEQRGWYGTIERGAYCIVTMLDDGWVYLQAPTNFGMLQPALLEAWAPQESVRPVANQAMSPFTRRH